MSRALPLAALLLGGLAAFGAAARAEEQRSPYEAAVLKALKAADDCTLINSRLRGVLRDEGLSESLKVENAVFSLTRQGLTRLHLSRPERVSLLDPACPADPKPPLEQGASDMRGELAHLLETHDCVIETRNPDLTALLDARRDEFVAAMGDLFSEGDFTQIGGFGPTRIVYRTGEFCAALNPADSREEEILRLDPAEAPNLLRQALLSRAEAGECALSGEEFARLAGNAEGLWDEAVDAALLDLAATRDAGRQTAEGETTILLNIGAPCR
ncbi:hypothetical protein [Neomegalonema sp.]|uniref:hypothetical protein n=1 Tax=Neomegalonema sp. TaxID=2039713 RepID=UPI00261D18AF|nr:hypothetical protein [Neomegalonema sp.]MDD2869904.1 hypothetical protein [Neomegalonema sp.]